MRFISIPEAYKKIKLIIQPISNSMKKILFSVSFFVLSLATFAQTKATPAKALLAAAYQQAGAEHKNVLLLFHASWCGWCHKMDASLNDPSVKKFFEDNYVITHLTTQESKAKKDLENEGVDSILSRLNASDVGLPFWVVLDSKGNLLKDSFMKDKDGNPTIIGCPATENEVAIFISILKATSKLNEAALATITTVFRKNESK